MTARINSTIPTQSRKLTDWTRPPVMARTIAITAMTTKRMFILCFLPGGRLGRGAEFLLGFLNVSLRRSLVLPVDTGAKQRYSPAVIYGDSRTTSEASLSGRQPRQLG